ncbi:MAG: hypothetical protein JSV24_03400 [Bacteroidales bacterium]|nr:MAG: hypothetical protein JSV24_03400 [Bacteroidales bacterium]
MKRFNTKGRMIFPSHKKHGKEKAEPEVIKECYCPNGHNLVNTQSVFREYNGIVLKVKCAGKSGLVFLSPICGDKSRFSFDVDLVEGELLEISCLECGASFPVYGPCDCGGQYITLFLGKDLEFTNCLGICNRVGCTNSWMRYGDEIRRCYMRETL